MVEYAHFRALKGDTDTARKFFQRAAMRGNQAAMWRY